MEKHEDRTIGSIVTAARQGDAAAWSELVNRFQGAAFGIAVGCSGDRDGARDVAQDAFALAFRNLGQLEDVEAFPAWFATIVRTACNRRTRTKRITTNALHGVDPPDDEPDPSTMVERAQERDRIRAAVEALPERERAVVALHYLGGLPYPDVAAFLGISVSAVKKRSFTARRRLGATLPDAARVPTAPPPSRGEPLRTTVRLFMAIRDRDRSAVDRLITEDPSLVHAAEDWSTEEALAAGLTFVFAGGASALIRAAQAGDLRIVQLLVERGASVRDTCACAGAESPLWNATVTGAADVVDYLLAAGADANATAFAGATPLHVAVQRGHHVLVPRLLAAGADPARRDDHGRTPADWLTRKRAEEDTNGQAAMTPTGIRAVDLFAPLRRGGVQHWPPAVGMGQTVLLFAIAHALRPADFWLLGFEHGPYNEAGARNEARETGVELRMRMANGGDAAARRVRFGRALSECLGSEGRKLVACVEGPGHAHDVILALPALSRDPAVLSTIVIEPFGGEYPLINAEPPEGFDAQIAFDIHRAKRGLWPAIDPTRTASRWYPSERHAALASRARSALGKVPFDGRCVPPLATYLAQPFEIAEPFTSRPGEHTPYETMLDDVETLLGGDEG
jgi:RNA polymerase sigma factor (sigma-70 family)